MNDQTFKEVMSARQGTIIDLLADLVKDSHVSLRPGFVALQDEGTIVNVRAIDYITPWAGEDVGVAATVSVRGTEFEVTAADLAIIERALGLHTASSPPAS